MKYKRLIIILSSVMFVVVLCTILSFTLFRVHNISLDFQNATVEFADETVQNEVIQSADVNTKIPIFALNKSQIAERLEKRNPKLKVINLETVFPNKLIIHCAEREKTFCVKARADVYYICDDNLKVLKVVGEPTSQTQGNMVHLSGVTVLNTGAVDGDLLDLYEGENVITKISTAFAYNNKNITDIKCMFKSIDFKYETNYYLCKATPTLTLTTYDDFKIVIRNADSYLTTKINLMLNIVPQKPQYYKTHQLVLDINPNNTNEVYCVMEVLWLILKFHYKE